MAQNSNKIMLRGREGVVGRKIHLRFDKCVVLPNQEDR